MGYQGGGQNYNQYNSYNNSSNGLYNQQNYQKKPAPVYKPKNNGFQGWYADTQPTKGMSQYKVENVSTGPTTTPAGSTLKLAAKAWTPSAPSFTPTAAPAISTPAPVSAPAQAPAP